MCMVGRVALISALMDPLAAQRAISSIAIEWVISVLFQSKEARGLARGLARGRGVCTSLWKPQEAGRPCCKGPHQVMCAAFYASCLYAQKAIAVMAKSDDNDNYRHNVISSHLLVWALVWLTLSPGSLRYFLAPGEITSTETTETHLEIPILSSAMITMMIIIFTTTMISSVRQRVGVT